MFIANLLNGLKNLFSLHFFISHLDYVDQEKCDFAIWIEGLDGKDLTPNTSRRS